MLVFLHLTRFLGSTQKISMNCIPGLTYPLAYDWLGSKTGTGKRWEKKGVKVQSIDFLNCFHSGTLFDYTHTFFLFNSLTSVRKFYFHDYFSSEILTPSWHFKMVDLNICTKMCGFYSKLTLKFISLKQILCKVYKK